MNGEHLSLLALVNLCLSASGRLAVNNAHWRNWPGDVGTSRFCRELGLLNDRHFNVVRLEENA